MGFLLFIVTTIILLIFIIIAGSIQQFAIYIVTKKKIEFVIMILPSLLSIICLSILTFSVYLILNIYDTSLLNILYYNFMNWEFDTSNLIYLFAAYFICFILFIILQGLCLRLVNLDYKKIWYKLIRKEEAMPLSPSENNSETSIDLLHYSKYDKLNFGSAILASLLSFSIIFFLFLFLLYCGKYIGMQYMIRR